MSRVASEANIVPSRHHGLTPRRPAEAKPQSTPFARLLDDAGAAPSPSDRTERPRPGSAGNAQADTSVRRGRENDRAEGAETEQPTAPADVSAEAIPEDNTVAEATATEATAAEATATEQRPPRNAAAEATAAEAAAADGLGDEEQPVAAIVLEVLAVEIDIAPRHRRR